jgi:predicted metal-dependent hydrolase
MQLVLPFAAEPPPVVYVRHRRARRFIVRVLDDGAVRVTLPRWGTRREAQAFLDQSRAWIERQQSLRRLPRREDARWRHGTPVLIDGAPVRLAIAPEGGAIVVRAGDVEVARGSAINRMDVRPAVERWLRDRAARELGPALLLLAAAHGVEVTRVLVLDQRSRWGACSRRGTITLNWRLVQAPPFVREYVMLHELMHRRELNHSRRFWRHVAQVCPRHREARRWLLTEGRQLFER